MRRERVRAGTRRSIATSQPEKVCLVKRGASSAACTFMPWSTTLETNCACACAWFSPPMMPNPMCTLPFSMNPGMMVWNGRLRGRERVGMRGIEIEQRPAILQMEAHALHRHTRAEAHTEALNQRDDVAVLVDDAEVDGVAAQSHRDRPGVASQRARAGSMSAARSRAYSFDEQPRDRHLRETRVGDETAQVLIRQLLRLDLEVERLRTQRREIGQREALHEVQHFERGDALARWAAVRTRSSRDTWSRSA